MENTHYEEFTESKGSVVTGFIGAFIGAMIGAAAWAVVGKLGYIASIIGFVIAFLADKGYDLFKGRKGTAKLVVLIICVVLAVLVGNVAALVWECHDVYTEEMAALTDFEKRYYTYPTEMEFIQTIFADSEVQAGMLKDSALGLLFGIMGAFGLLKAAKNGKKAQSVEEQGAFNEAFEDVQPAAIEASDAVESNTDTNESAS
ncbi:MAG: hypothetical protein IJ438_04520 [Clostridia bacterium]|nr:hypothetical protein [Clostridia bacterium]